MKKLLLILALTTFTCCFSQAIKVDTNKYTSTQLVNTVLINSPCVSATNVISKTGSNFASTNGIGFFQNTNPNFPMKSGVILSTGSVMNAVGPNTSVLNDGAANWPGDLDLENTMAQSGIKMNSVNASILEFDFTPISPTFSFEFLFASEEYGNFQCQFSDAFAFLLTNTVTGTTTNLAVVPKTTSPISVLTIRDYLYNSSCPSSNPEYFGSYNGDSAAASSPTNFNGQTKLLNASATLVPNTPYHIKLVIADRTDSGSDSAIFIASDAFNIGQDVLGEDLTVASNTAICYGDSYTINTNLDPTIYKFSWTKDGTKIAGANGASLNITKAGTYGVTYEKIINDCQPITDLVKIEYFPQIITKNPVNLYKCDSGLSSYLYDLSYNTSIVKTGLNPSTEVSYYASSADANAGINNLPLTYLASPGQTVYVKIKNSNNPCFVVKSFQLLTTTAPIANQPKDLTVCSTTPTSNNGVFKLFQQNYYILNGQPSATNNVSYYSSLLDANSGLNQLNFNSYTAANNTTIYARVQNIYDTSCFNITSFKLIVNPTPLVDKLLDVIACNNYALPVLTNGNYFSGPNGTGKKLLAGDVIDKTSTVYIFNQPDGPGGCSNGTSFKITIIDVLAQVPKSGTYCGSYALPALPYGNYYTESGGKGDKIVAGTKITSTKTLYFYYKTPTEPFCELDADFTITIIPIQYVSNYENVFDCTSYTLPALTAGNYYTQPNGGGNLLAPGTVITTSQKIYVFSTTGSPNYCTSQTSFEVVIGIKTPGEISQCGSYTLPKLPIGKYYTGPSGTGTEIAGGTIISESKTIYIYVANAGNPNCTDDIHFTISIGQPKIDILDNITACESYALPTLTGGTYYTGPNGTGTVLNAGDLITTSKTIYIYKKSSSTCSNQSSFKVTINKKPSIDSRSDIDICNYYQLTPLSFGDYYTGPGGTGTKLPAGTIIKNTQTIYIYATSSTTNCSDENSFTINIYSIEADSPANVTACDSYTLPTLKIGNYYSLPGGPSGGEGSLMHAGDVITKTQTIYVYTESGERINCTDENSFVVTINHTPIISPISDIKTCNSYTLPKLTIGNYFTSPNGTGTMLKENDLITTNQTIYVYAETGTVPNCSDEKSFKVTLFNVDDLPNVTICENYTLPVLNIGKYYTGPTGTGKLLNPGQVLNSTQTVYIYSPSPFSPICYDESSFKVTIVDTPVVHSVPSSMTTICDEDGTNDGITSFNLSQLDSTILGNQTSSEFTVKYYNSQSDAATEKNSITSTELKIVFARVSNTLTTNCYDIRTIAITVIKSPSPNPKGGIICYDSKTNTSLNSYTIPSGLNASEHSFKWLDDSNKVVGTSSTYEAKLPGVYTLIATNKTSGCSSFPISVEVSPSEPAVISYTVSDDFSDNQILTIEAKGVGGNYEYQLDSEEFQDSPVFQNVSSGNHTITVRDKNGCGNSVTQALVVNYPKYFTPNGDGVNDTWNITSLKDQGNSTISIFDRYGKIITEIQPSGQGWDGTYKGQSLPSTDYWFSINYHADGIEKEFKSHFSMKR